MMLIGLVRNIQTFSDMNNLLILGAGQYGMVAKEIAESTGFFETISFLDDNNPIAIGKLNDHMYFSEEYKYAVVAIGNAEIRLRLIAELEQSGYEISSLIHDKAYVSRSAKVDKGTIVEPMAVIHTDVSIGIGCIISAGVIINHNSIIGDGCHIDCGTIVGARTVVKAGTRSKYRAVLTEKV